MIVLFALLNFFFLDRDSKKCAEYHGHKHVHKMILESAQILSNVWHIVNPDGVPEGIYAKSKSHIKHPVVLWASKSLAHYEKILDVALELANERRKRKYSEKHKTEDVLAILRANKPDLKMFSCANQWLDPPKCIPKEYHVDEHDKPLDVVQSYRLCYAGDKYEIIENRWEPRAKKPKWFQECRNYIAKRPDIQKGIAERKAQYLGQKKKRVEKRKLKKDKQSQNKKSKNY